MAESNDSPSAEDSDALELKEHQDAAQLSPVGMLVRDLLAKMNAAGEDAEEAYQEALAALRKRPIEAVIELARQECAYCPQDYPTRWAVVYAVTTLEHRAAIPLLKSIVLTPIPPERNRDPHASTVAEETVIRTTAVDGIAFLALQGENEAIEALMEFLDLPSFSIRRATIQGLLGSPKGDDLRDRIARCLPKDQQFLLEIKPIDVRKALQVENPQQHLSEAGRADSKPAPPDARNRRPTKQADTQHRDGTSHNGESPKAGDQQDQGTPEA